nr:helix-turn-helix transcriptional regulator [uncultured Lachnoanaerobaculum sp.]
MRFITLEAARKNAGYTQKEVAEKIGIHNQTVSKYENDSSKIPFDLMEKLCNLYGVTKDEVFFGKKVRKK